MNLLVHNATTEQTAVTAVGSAQLKIMVSSRLTSIRSTEMLHDSS